MRCFRSRISDVLDLAGKGVGSVELSIGDLVASIFFF